MATMNKLTHVQQQFLQILNIQLLQARPEIITEYAAEHLASLPPNAPENLTLTTGHVSTGKLATEKGVDFVHDNASYIAERTNQLITPSQDRATVSRADIAIDTQTDTPTDTLTESPTASAIAGHAINSAMQSETQLLPTLDLAGSSALLQDINQLLQANTSLQIIEQPQLAEDFMEIGNTFFLRDRASLQQAKTKRQVWQWLGQHLDAIAQAKPTLPQ